MVLRLIVLGTDKTGDVPNLVTTMLTLARLQSKHAVHVAAASLYQLHRL